MRIKKMTAAFGALDGAVLEPGPGLTVIAAPNEGGKSTWAGFWKAMLYGIDTRERDRAGYLADKNRWQPWSGVPMSGELQVEWEGRDVTIRRFPTRSGAFSGFEAVYTATGDPVPGLTARNAGEKLTGAGREVFLRSAFVGQGSSTITPNGELEARVAALATSGLEDVSYSDTERVLKAWRNRRQANRTKGLIPQLEAEQSELRRALREMEQSQSRQAENSARLASLKRERDELIAGLDSWKRLEQRELNRRYSIAMEEWKAALQKVPNHGPHPIFGTMSGEEAQEFAQKMVENREQIEEENRRRVARQAEARKKRGKGRAEAVIGGLCIAAFCAVCLLMQEWTVRAASGAGLLAALMVLIHGLVQSSRAKKEEDAARPVPVPEADDLLAEVAAYRAELIQVQQATAAADAAHRRVEDLSAQGGQLADTLEMIPPPAQSKLTMTARLGAVERELERCQTEQARTEGALDQMGNIEQMSARLAQVEVQLPQRVEEYNALNIALEALSAADSALRERFSPALNREAGLIFSTLTGGRYPRMSLARDFTAQAVAEGDMIPHSALALSTGTAEQLYLAVRLAVCKLSLPDAPILLDDALTAFDDERMGLALEYLQGLAKERQILLFSCHRREAEWAKAHHCTVVEL